MAGDAEVHWQQVTLPVHRREVAARVYRPAGTSGDWLVWAHGGSWSAGSVADWHLALLTMATKPRESHNSGGQTQTSTGRAALARKRQGRPTLRPPPR